MKKAAYTGIAKNYKQGTFVIKALFCDLLDWEL